MQRNFYLYITAIQNDQIMGKIYPIGIQNFESLRKDGYFYIDKTRFIYQLVKTSHYYFLSRPATLVEVY